MSYAIQTGDGKFLDISWSNGPFQSLNPKKRGPASQKIWDVRLQAKPINKSNNVTYVSQRAATQDMRDAILYMSMQLHRFRAKIQALKVEVDAAKRAGAKAAAAAGKLSTDGPGPDLERHISRLNKLQRQISHTNLTAKHRQADAEQLLKLVRYWDKAISSLSVVAL